MTSEAGKEFWRGVCGPKVTPADLGFEQMTLNRGAGEDGDGDGDGDSYPFVKSIERHLDCWVVECHGYRHDGQYRVPVRDDTKPGYKLLVPAGWPFWFSGFPKEREPDGDPDE